MGSIEGRIGNNQGLTPSLPGDRLSGFSLPEHASIKKSGAEFPELDPPLGWPTFCFLESNHVNDGPESSTTNLAQLRLLVGVPLAPWRDCFLNCRHQRRSTCGPFTQRNMQTVTGKIPFLQD